MDYYLKYLEVSRKLKNNNVQREAKISILEREIQRLKIQLINPVIIPEFNKDLKDILHIVSECSMVTPSDILRGGRKQEYVVARFCFCYLAHKSGFGCSEVGRFLNKDHTTIIHARNQFEKWLELGYKYEVNLYKKCEARL